MLQLRINIEGLERYHVQAGHMIHDISYVPLRNAMYHPEIKTNALERQFRRTMS